MLIARLAPGTTAEQAVAEATPAFQVAAYASLGTSDPKHPKVALALVPAKGIQGLGDNYRQPVTILMALVTLVLIIACCNVAMLIVARNASRQRDFSLRLALGARRSALLRQLLTESGLLVLSGTLLGWLLALGGARALAAWSQLEVNLKPDRHHIALRLHRFRSRRFSLRPCATANGNQRSGHRGFARNALHQLSAKAERQRRAGAAGCALFHAVDRRWVVTADSAPV